VHVEGKAASENMYTSIDQALEKAERQLRKLREKVQDHH
jgi:ribosomal subunit interface protein